MRLCRIIGHKEMLTGMMFVDIMRTQQFMHRLQTKRGRRKEGGVRANLVAFMQCIVLLQRPVVLSTGYISEHWGGRSWSRYAIVAE